MDSAPAGSQNEVMMPMLANGSYLASKLPKATRFDAGRPIPELPLSGSESEAEAVDYPDSDSSLTMSTNSISQISPGAKRKSSPPSPHGTPKTQKLVPQPYAGHGNSFALLTSLDDNDDMDVEVPADPFVDGTSCDASRSLGAPRSQDAPFIIAGLTGLREITALVKTVTNNFKIKNIGSSSARLTVKDGKTYREVQNLLQANEIPYNSWQPKEERSFRVVARGLHSDTDKQDISDDLTALDHKVRNIHNASSRTSGKKLNLFFIELEPAPNNKQIYDVKIINHQIVAFEPPIRRGDIPRCYRSQEFGHTRSYCSKAFKCAKCGGPHDAKEEALCPAKSQEQYFCINCGGNHAASYRCCPAYLDAVNKRKGNAPAKTVPIQRRSQLSPPRVNVWDISSPDHPAHASSRPLHQPDHVSLSVDQDPSQWPVLGNPVTSGASSRPLSTAASSSSCGVSVLHQPAQERLLQQILSLQAAQQKDAHAQSSSVEKLLSRLDQMMALLMQVMGKSKLTSLLINDPPCAAEDLVEKIHTAAAASMVNHRNVLPLGPPRAPLKPEILALLRRKRELRRRWMRTRHPLDQAEFKAATDVLRKALFEAKSEFFVEKLRAIDPNQNRGFALWKCTRGLKRQPLRRFSLLRRDGTWARSDLEIAEEFATDLSERFTPWHLTRKCWPQLLMLVSSPALLFLSLQ
ncbi:hypothetical protein ACLKA6_018825 [Drosophila palustris]